MKIAVFSLPLNTNYGGILQAYALQKVLQHLGHSPVLLERKRLVCIPAGIKNKFVYAIAKHFFKKESLLQVVSEQVDSFINEYIYIRKEPNLERHLDTETYDAYIVGSDQVWRPIWGNRMSDYFLEFANQNSSIIKIAYAASFAVDDWEFTPSETEMYKPLAQQFNTISVREKSGIKLCRQYFNVEAVQMLDPTLLLEKSHYELLVKEKNEPKNHGNMFCYILDDSPEKQQLVNIMAKQLSATVYDVKKTVNTRLMQLILNKKRYQVPAVTKWLRAFMDAEYVITDSFHGCVFSIIFNKPFWTIGNAGRGMARFTSLLELFHLEDRIIPENMDSKRFDFAKPIDWVSVNAIKKIWQERSMNFLTSNLCKSK